LEKIVRAHHVVIVEPELFYAFGFCGDGDGGGVLDQPVERRRILWRYGSPGVESIQVDVEDVGRGFQMRQSNPA
jgi:hypothetical protein